jgi:hypothetical protein
MQDNQNKETSAAEVQAEYKKIQNIWVGDKRWFEGRMCQFNSPYRHNCFCMVCIPTRSSYKTVHSCYLTIYFKSHLCHVGEAIRKTELSRIFIIFLWFKVKKFFANNTSNLGDLGIDRRIILKSVLEYKGLHRYTEFRTRSTVEFLWIYYRYFRLLKHMKMSWKSDHQLLKVRPFVEFTKPWYWILQSVNRF